MNDTNRWKLGAFVLALIAVLAAAGVAAGRWLFDDEIAIGVAYFDESVKGLSIGAPVSLRGVRLGRVDAIDLAPDHRHVAVRLALPHDRLRKAGIDPARAEASAEGLHSMLPAGMRVRLATSGLAGSKYIQVTFFDDPPPIPDYPFELPDNYCATAPSTITGLRRAADDVLNRLPDAIDRIASAAAALEGGVEAAAIGQRSGELAALLATADGLVAELRRAADQLEVEGVQSDLRSALQSAERSLTATRGDLSRILDPDQGPLVAVLTGADEALSGVDAAGADLRSLKVDLRRALGAVSDAAERVAALAALLEREPGALLHGRRSPADGAQEVDDGP